MFAQNSSLGTFLDLSLGRPGDVEDNGYEGTFLIGTHAPEFSAITQAPQVQRLTPGQWTGLVDGFIVNGRNVTTAKSVVDGAPAGSFVALFDSGTSTGALSADLLDAFYGQIPGAIVVNSTYYVPCYSAVNVTVVVGYVISFLLSIVPDCLYT